MLTFVLISILVTFFIIGILAGLLGIYGFFGGGEEEAGCMIMIISFGIMLLVFFMAMIMKFLGF